MCNICIHGQDEHISPLSEYQIVMSQLVFILVFHALTFLQISVSLTRISTILEKEPQTEE